MKLKCSRIRYKNHDSGYFIADFFDDGKKITGKGYLVDLFIGATLYNVIGEMREAKDYGEFLFIQDCLMPVPSNPDQLIMYLSSDAFKGVGLRTAEKIVRRFGMNTPDILDNDPERLCEISGFPAARREDFITSWKEKNAVKETQSFLASIGASPDIARKLVKVYGDNTVTQLKRNPYQICQDVEGIGFIRADDIARKMGIAELSGRRVKAGIGYTLDAAGNEGHVFLFYDQLKEAAKKALKAPDELITACIEKAVEDNVIVKEEDRFYSHQMFSSEEVSAKRLKNIINSRSSKKMAPETLWEYVAKKEMFDEGQKAAIMTAFSSKVMVLTGGPGTGKTTTINGFLHAFLNAGYDVKLAAPTGKAAKRMTEATGQEACTIHRLLRQNREGKFTMNMSNKISGDLLIVDESSMIDLPLLCHLLEAVPNSMSVIFVGDIDQLPSVGEGCVFRDLIECGCVAVARLTKVHRQAGESQIVFNAHRINNGESILIKQGKDKDFMVVTAETEDEGLKKIVKMCKEQLPSYYHVDPVSDIQVLAPMKKGSVGTMEINNALQKALNPETVHADRSDKVSIRKGDKVMQFSNNYKKGVFNGDTGIVKDIDLAEDEITIEFDGKEVLYSKAELDEINLSYACTIHKSQGSEYPVVIIPVYDSQKIMLQRNLLYTGVTRAKKLVILVGQRSAIDYSIMNSTASFRNSSLADRIREVVNNNGSLKKTA